MSGENILIVDDELHLRNAMRLSLVSRGYQVEVAGTVEEGLLKIATARPELIILDYMLPDKPGLELVAANRKSGLSIPVILVSAESNGIVLWKALKLGIVDMLTKPMEPNTLRQRVFALLQRRTKQELMDYRSVVKRATLQLQELNPKQALSLLDSRLSAEEDSPGLNLLRYMATRLCQVEDGGDNFSSINWPSTWHLSSSPQYFQEYCEKTSGLLDDRL